MAKKPRVHEIAKELGIDSHEALQKLKELGEFVKSPSSTIQVPVARKLRAAFSPYTPLQPSAVSTTTGPQHPEAVAANIRREVVRRDDSDWTRYGLSASERATWLRAGIPENKAHIAAMCRDSGKRSSTQLSLTADNLHIRLGRGPDTQTVLGALLDGANYLRVQERLASVLGVPLSGINSDLLRLTTSSKLPPESNGPALGRSFTAIKWEPGASVRIAEAAADVIVSALPLARAHTDLRTQIDAYRHNATVQPLLAAYARAHGVMHPGPALDRLVQGVTGSSAEHITGLEAAELVERAVASRRFFYLRPEAARELEVQTNVEVGDDILPPSPAGVALLAGSDDPDARPRRIAFWFTDRLGAMKCLMVPTTVFSSPKTHRVLSMGSMVQSWEPNTPHPANLEASAFLDRFATRRTRPLAQNKKPNGGGSGLGREAGTRSDPPELRDIVISYFARFPQQGVSDKARARSAADRRWVVRGHWRRQWYRATKDHRTIWIDQHEAGPAEHPLLIAERVEVH